MSSTVRSFCFQKLPVFVEVFLGLTLYSVQQELNQKLKNCKGSEILTYIQANDTKISSVGVRLIESKSPHSETKTIYCHGKSSSQSSLAWFPKLQSPKGSSYRVGTSALQYRNHKIWKLWSYISREKETLSLLWNTSTL